MDPRVRACLLVAGVLAASVSAAVVLHEDDAGVAPTDRVPADVDYVGHLEPAPMRDDPEVRRATRLSLRFQSAVEFYDGPDFHRSFALREAGPGGRVAWVTYFGRENGSYRGRIVRAEWTTDALVASVERAANATLTRTEWHGAPAHVGDGRAVAVLGNDTFAVGSPAAVRDATAVAAGENASLGGPLRERFERTDGFARFAYRFRPATVPSYPFVGETIHRVEFVAGSYRRNGSTLTTTTNVTVADATAADGVAAVLQAGLTFYRFESTNETLTRELGRIEVARSGRVVHASYASEASNYPVLVRGLYRNQPEPSAEGSG